MKKSIAIFILLSLFTSMGVSRVPERNNYIILTTEDLLPSAILFRDYRSNRYDVSIVTVEEIGSNKPPNIRRYLKDHYSRGYLLILGGEESVPRPLLYPSSQNHDFSNTAPGAVESDIFYSLSGNIDYDGDGFPGELFEDRVNFEASYVVGRIPFDDNSMIEKVFENIVKFEDNPPDKAVLAASFVSFPGELYQGSHIFNGDGARLFELLRGILPCKVVTLYEKQGSFPSIFDCHLPLDKENFYNEIRDASFVNWCAHGSLTDAFSEYWVDKNENGAPDDGFTFKSFISAEDNFKASGIFFSDSCLNEKNGNNLGKAVLEKGGVAFIGSTEISFTPSYFHSPEDGGSQCINYYFVKNLVEGNSVGKSLYNAFDIYFDKYLFSDLEDPFESGLMNIYDFNLYGDPAVIWRFEDNFVSPPLIAERTLESFPIVFHCSGEFELSVDLPRKDDYFIKLPPHSLYVTSVSVDGVIVDNAFGIVRLNGVGGEVKIKGRARGTAFAEVSVFTDEVQNNASIEISGYNLRDINFDGVVNEGDFKGMVESFGKTYMDEDFNEFCDLNFDHKVSGRDIFIFIFGD